MPGEPLTSRAIDDLLFRGDDYERSIFEVGGLVISSALIEASLIVFEIYDASLTFSKDVLESIETESVSSLDIWSRGGVRDSFNSSMK